VPRRITRGEEKILLSLGKGVDFLSGAADAPEAGDVGMSQKGGLSPPRVSTILIRGCYIAHERRLEQEKEIRDRLPQDQWSKKGRGLFPF